MYAIRLGTLKTLILAEDGREQIAGFFMGGEIVGADGLGENRYRCDATALEDSEVCVIPFALLDGSRTRFRRFGATCTGASPARCAGGSR